MISQCSQSSYLCPELSCLLPEWFSYCYTTYACDITTWAWQLHISSLVAPPYVFSHYYVKEGCQTAYRRWIIPPAGNRWHQVILICFREVIVCTMFTSSRTTLPFIYLILFIYPYSIHFCDLPDSSVLILVKICISICHSQWLCCTSDSVQTTSSAFPLL